MSLNLFGAFIFSIFTYQSVSQNITKEIQPPFNIKTVGFTKNNAFSYPFFKLGEPKGNACLCDAKPSLIQSFAEIKVLR